MFRYKPSFIPTTFVVVGAGGTGSRFVPLLAQFLKTAAWIPNPKIYLIDHDTVEDKNLVRQNFIKLDINKPKAIVVAERYSKAFDINIIPIVKKVGHVTIDNYFKLSDMTDTTSEVATLENVKNAIVVMCVDSAEARKAILSRLLYPGSRNLLILDAGNGNDFGQVVIYNDNIFSTPAEYVRDTVKNMCLPGGLVPIDIDLPIIPCPTEFYRTMIDVAEKSCAQLDQTLAINATMATAMMGIIQSFLFQKNIQYHKLNISLEHGAVPEYMTLSYIVANCFDPKREISPGMGITRGVNPFGFLHNLDNGILKLKHEQTQTKQKEARKEDSKKEVTPTLANSLAVAEEWITLTAERVGRAAEAARVAQIEQAIQTQARAVQMELVQQNTARTLELAQQAAQTVQAQQPLGAWTESVIAAQTIEVMQPIEPHQPPRPPNHEPVI